MKNDTTSERIRLSVREAVYAAAEATRRYLAGDDQPEIRDPKTGYRDRAKHAELFFQREGNAAPSLGDVIEKFAQRLIETVDADGHERRERVRRIQEVVYAQYAHAFISSVSGAVVDGHLYDLSQQHGTPTAALMAAAALGAIDGKSQERRLRTESELVTEVERLAPGCIEKTLATLATPEKE